MEAYIIQISWTFRGESGHETITKAFFDMSKACEHLKKICNNERDDTWLCDVLDENLKPYPDVTLQEYVCTDNYFLVESEEHEARTEVWIDDIEIE